MSETSNSTSTSSSSSSVVWFVQDCNRHMLVHFSWFTRHTQCLQARIHLHDISCNTASGAGDQSCHRHLWFIPSPWDLEQQVHLQGSVDKLQPGSSHKGYACTSSPCKGTADCNLPHLVLYRRGGGGAS